MLIAGAVVARDALKGSPSYRDRAHGMDFAGCREAGPAGPAGRPGSGDVTIGPLVLVGAEGLTGEPARAFGGHGYAIPVTLPRGERATLAVPRAFREEVGLAFTERRLRRATEGGVDSANAGVHFIACPTGKAEKATESDPKASGATGPDSLESKEPGSDLERSRWVGGLVVDRPRCVLLQLRRSGERTITARVPAGRACKKE